VPLQDFTEPNGEAEARTSGWVVTFADLMALLMCFFVLLLSFSSMDVEKYKRIAASMRNTFGVGAPGGVESFATGSVESPASVAPPAAQQPTAVCAPLQPDAAQLQRSAAEQGVVDKVAALIAQTERDAVTLAAALSKEIAAGVLEVETNGRKIILRVREHGSFPSGSASLTNDFKPVLKIIRGVLKDTTGQISVEGHTDDVPITTSRFRSNLELSSARAVSVAQGLSEDGALDVRRFTATGYADTRPLDSNDTLEGRARNRRVEVVIQQGLGDAVKRDLDALRSSDAEGFERARVELMRRFNLKPDEIY